MAEPEMSPRAARSPRGRLVPTFACLAALTGCAGAIGPTDEPASGGPAAGGAGDHPGLAGVAPAAPRPAPLPGPACAARPDVPEAPLRRLSRAQYRRVVMDLLQVDVVAPHELPSDERLGPFVSNGRAPVTELHVEQYRDAAETIAAAAVRRLEALAPCDPTAVGAEACARQFIARFGERAFRRPLAPEEQRELEALHATIAARSSFADGVRVVIQSLLQAPQFLYRLELGEGTGPVVPFTDRELAHRLALFLWDGLPDEPLLADAAAGRLGTPQALGGHARRMLASPRARPVIRRFGAEWLGLEELPGLAKDGKIYPTFNAALAQRMLGETERFFEHVLLQGDARLETLLLASFSFLEGPLYALYGVTPPAPSGSGWQRVALDPAVRAGVLTHAGVLATNAHPDQTSPVHRGKLVRSELLCQQLAPPPPDVDDSPPPLERGLTTRERLARKTAPAECAGCHRLLNPVGFGLESYDGIGRHRTHEEGRPVDSTGELVGTRDADGPFQGGVELGRRLAASGEVRDCVATQWLRYALGRLEDERDACTIERLGAAMRASRGDLRELVLALVTSDAFRLRRIADATTEGSR
jgi:hypothetical protein